MVVEWHRTTATVATSTREPAEWLGLMADPLLAQSAIDRLQCATHELVLDGESYRQRQRPASPNPTTALTAHHRATPAPTLTPRAITLPQRGPQTGSRCELRQGWRYKLGGRLNIACTGCDDHSAEGAEARGPETVDNPAVVH